MELSHEQMFLNLLRAMPDEQLLELQTRLTNELERRGITPEPTEPEHDRLENGK